MNAIAEVGHSLSIQIARQALLASREERCVHRDTSSCCVSPFGLSNSVATLAFRQSHSVTRESSQADNSDWLSGVKTSERTRLCRASSVCNVLPVVVSQSRMTLLQPAIASVRLSGAKATLYMGSSEK